MKINAGDRFGRLIAVEKAPKEPGDKNHHTKWICRCDCGNFTVVSSDKLRQGETKSCGCLKKELSIAKILKCKGNQKTHGQSRTRLYNIYHHMIRRCRDCQNPKYKDYGARGITVCSEWEKDFNAFYKWATNAGYEETLTLDRIDVDGDYEPSNCRWATPKQQANNKRSNVFVEYNGKMVTLSELSDAVGIPQATIWWRYSHGWPVERLTERVNKR